ncbi:hypothetical protein A6A03_13305 [Chloroflexus islandicus]|uniref:CAAX prenyl protease 2/Lysostaphin resistance protein A-like domain-containing protein n=1 Tax=Chloroflexus islandicus TaxID=1707952 RepID=A0A178ME37_9CHLR|nr:CPBP family glutamic-type intramembrane protease [Chloroflexus islandicus]OAN46114.1 hypothetical protein A6A03_13305 [Chloroflexus islandicus]
MNTLSPNAISNPILDFFAFVRRPDAAHIVTSRKAKLLIIVSLLGLSILLSVAGNVVSTSIETFIPMETEHIMAGEDEEFLRYMAIAGIPIIPFFEEVMFRLWLAPNLLFFFISFSLVTIQFAPMPFIDLLRAAGLEPIAPLVKIGFYLALGGLIVLWFWWRDRRGQRYADFFHRYVAVYYYVSVIVFGLLHLTNYTTVGAWWFAPLLVLPQLIGGFIYGYVRIRIGFWYAVLLHMADNLLFTLGDVMNMLFGPLGGVVWLAVLVLSSLAIVVVTFKQSLVLGEKAPLQA